MLEAQRAVFAMASLLFRIERSRRAAFVFAAMSAISKLPRRRRAGGGSSYRRRGSYRRNFELLDVLYAAGLRSLGPVWSRPNAFGHGVPFRCPSSPDTGPGLTDLGKALIGACNRLRILIDLSHLNERGFWDVAEISNAPLVATHSNAHAISPHSRNLTDRQLGAIGETGGLVGVNFARASFVRTAAATNTRLRPDHRTYRAHARTCRRGQRRLRLRFRRRRDSGRTRQCRRPAKFGQAMRKRGFGER